MDAEGAVNDSTTEQAESRLTDIEAFEKQSDELSAQRKRRELAHASVLQWGREEHLAQRLETWRRAKGWSQETLSKRLREVDCYMPQSAISKIENPGPGGRRAVTVDEAIGLARVLDVSLDELLVPDFLFRSVELQRMVRDGTNALYGIRLSEREVEKAVRRAQEAAAEDPEIASGLCLMLEQAVARQRLLQADSVDLEDLSDVIFLRRVVEGLEQ